MSYELQQILDSIKKISFPEKKQLFDFLQKELLSVPDTTKETLSKELVQLISINNLERIYVDGGHGGWTRKLGFGDAALGQVTDSKGRSLIQEHRHLFQLPMPIQKTQINGINLEVIVCDFKDPAAAQQKNNEAELVALIAGLQIGIHLKASHVYSDSQLILDYWSQNFVNTKKRASLKESCPAKLLAIERCSHLRKQFERLGGKLCKIAGGENPADFGFH